jgi:diketogulonate reductase-like aldo/keto reductase
MKSEKLADGTPVPAIGLGTWGIGGGSRPDRSQDGRLVAAIQAALQLGYTHIDTAEMYAGGHTEQLVGQAIRGLNRQDLILVSKVWTDHLRYDRLLAACQASLDRLGVDYLDIYLVHWPNKSVPLEETFRALNQLVSDGRVLHIGVSNFNLDQLRRAHQLAKTPLATNQVPYSLFERSYAKNGVLEYCQQNGILLTAYTPIEKGRVARNPLVKQLAARYSATPVQIALSWLLQQPGVIAIPMSTNPQHLRENLESASLQLSNEDMQRLNLLA